MSKSRTIIVALFVLLAPGLIFSVASFTYDNWAKTKEPTLVRSKSIPTAGGYTDEFGVYHYQGRVIDSDDNPIPGAKVFYHGGGNLRDYGTSALTNSEGYFDLPDPNTGLGTCGTGASLAAFAPGLAGKSYFGDRNSARGRIIELHPTGRITGRIVDSDGQPVDNATIILINFKMETVNTNAEGVYAIDDASLGSYFDLIAQSSKYGQATYRYMRHGMKEKPEYTDTFVVPDLVLNSQERFVAGIVTNAEGEPVGGARVSCGEPTTDELLATTTADSDGRFVINRLTEREYRLEAAKYYRIYPPGYGPIPAPPKGHASAFGGDANITIVIN